MPTSRVSWPLYEVSDSFLECLWCVHTQRIAEIWWLVKYIIADATICIACGEYLEFTSDMRLASLSDETIESLSLIQRILLRNAALHIRAKRRMLSRN